MNTKDIFQNPLYKAIVLLPLFLGAYWFPLRGIVNTWITNDDYSYGFLIPFISVYLLWDKRSSLRGLQLRSSWFILPFLLFFILLSVYGVLGSSENISRPAIPVLIILFVAFCFGIELTKKLILPLGFLFFLVPLPPILDRTFGVFLKAISSQLGAIIIQMYGLSVHVSGNIIDLGVTQLQVVDACSGLRFVFPLFALGIIYAYFFEHVLWKRAFCVFATIPIAILTNGLRIGITGILTDTYGPEVAEGFFHGFSGWAIFMVAFVIIFLVGRFLRLFPPKGRIKRNSRPSDETQGDDFTIIRRGGNGAFIVSILLLLMVGALSWTTKTLPALEIRGGIKGFPSAFGDWRGRATPVDPEIIIKSGAEDAFDGLYKNSNHDEVSLYLGYRSTAFLENENFFHSPTVCLPASGWKSKETSTHKITNVPFFGDILVTKMIVEHFGIKQLVYFWFQTKNKATPNKNINRFHLALHAIKRDNTHDLFIRTITPMRQNEKVEDVERRMDLFVREMMNSLLQFLGENQSEIR